jgi:hypothetical protein
MSIVRGFLVLLGLVFGWLGIWTLLDHNAVAAVFEIGLPTASAAVQFMVVFGGFELGFGTFLIWCALRKAYVPAGLLSLVFGIGCAAARARARDADAGAGQAGLHAVPRVRGRHTVLAALFLRYVLRQVRLG